MLLLVLVVLFYVIGIPIWLIALSLKVSGLKEQLQQGQENNPYVSKPDEFTTPTDPLPSIPQAMEKEAVSPSPLPAEEASVELNEHFTEDATVTAAISQTEESKAPHQSEPSSTREPISFVQLFSWIGGFILLLGVLFWIKYALENNIISPAMRVTLGTISGIGMWIAGALLRKPNVKTTSDTLCACGLCICYSIWFAAYYFYHMVSPGTTFVLLGLVALASFATAVWKNAQYIGILAQVIGFLTPALFPSDTPRIWFLLAYTGIINITAVAAAIKRNWTHQLFTGLGFTALCFFSVVKASNPLQLVFFPGFFALFYTAVASWRKNTGLLRVSFIFTTIALFILGLYSSPVETYLLPYLIGFAGFFAIGFGLLAAWQKNDELCLYTLGFALVSIVFIATQHSFLALFLFAGALSAFFGILTSRLQKRSLQIGSLLLAAIGFITFFCCGQVTWLEEAYLPYLAGFAAIFTLFFACISYRQKNESLLVSTFLLALFFFLFLVPFRNEVYLVALAGGYTLLFGLISTKMKNSSLQLTSVLLTTICTILICALGKLNLHLVLTFAMLSTVFYVCFSIKQKNGALFAAAALSLAIPLLMLTIWTCCHHRGNELLSWLIGWNALVALIPFVFKENFQTSKTTWVAVTICNLLAGALILLICNMDETLSSAAGGVAFILAFVHGLFTERVLRWQPLEEGLQHFRISSLVWAPIVFTTWGIALQCVNEWMTIGFAVEAVILVGLWHSLKLNLLQNVGLGLFGLVAIRLLLNPFIVTYYDETQLLFNWYLYTYLFCAGTMFTAASLWRPVNKEGPTTALQVMGGLLLFALVNIEIACNFAGGKGLHFNFCGEVAEAAAYTIAWALCGAVCMFCATRKKLWLLHVGIGLVGLAVLKLFMADIWQLSSGLRVAVLIGVALIMLGISFVYQGFKKSRPQ